MRSPSCVCRRAVTVAVSVIHYPLCVPAALRSDPAASTAHDMCKQGAVCSVYQQRAAVRQSTVGTCVCTTHSLCITPRPLAHTSHITHGVNIGCPDLPRSHNRPVGLDPRLPALCPLPRGVSGPFTRCRKQGSCTAAVPCTQRGFRQCCTHVACQWWLSSDRVMQLPLSCWMRLACQIGRASLLCHDCARSSDSFFM